MPGRLFPCFACYHLKVFRTVILVPAEMRLPPFHRQKGDCLKRSDGPDVEIDVEHLIQTQESVRFDVAEASPRRTVRTTVQQWKRSRSEKRKHANKSTA